jgi:hypothetical protein
MEDEKNVVVVSIGNYSFNILSKEKFYAFPKGSRKVGEYFAFYKNGKIEYYAKVSLSKEGGKEEVGAGYWIYCMPDAEPPYQIIKFNKLIKLKNPIVKNTGRGGYIQGTRYTSIKKLLKAKTIKDLF